jgi:hypothetical protein
VAKSAARQRAELSQRIAKAVAMICRLCQDVVAAGRATAALYSGRMAAAEEAGEAERAARRGKEFDARLARGLYQVQMPVPSKHPLNELFIGLCENLQTCEILQYFVSRK